MKKRKSEHVGMCLRRSSCKTHLLLEGKGVVIDEEGQDLDEWMTSQSGQKLRLMRKWKVQQKTHIWKSTALNRLVEYADDDDGDDDDDDGDGDDGGDFDDDDILYIHI